MFLINEFINNIKDLGHLDIVHVGAHAGEEATVYDSLKATVTWIEANTGLIPKLIENVHKYGHKVINALVLDRPYPEIDFHLSNNNQSSSVLDLREHLTLHPDVKYIDKVRIEAVTLDSLGLHPNVLNMDVQGVEGLVVRGGQETLKNVVVVYAEVNFTEVYRDCTLIHELDALLEGFERVATFRANSGWGDAVYRMK